MSSAPSRGLIGVEATDPAEPAVLVVSAPVTFADVPLLCERLRALYGGGVEEVVCDLAALTRADLAAVEAVARLRLTARRAGGRLRVRNAGAGVAALLELAGLGLD
ncbi:lipid asymmetry maintenance protein MlaB [Streptomyces sp. NPDC050485]|uniref:lipid asymmetry maintenance protein MlaB n=1 Tax=Streptomyces sp. NPDC050485 TaxID=3365617 RepID=UPI0037A221F1